MRDDRAGTRTRARRQTRTAQTARLTALAAALLVLALPGVAMAAPEDPTGLVNPFIGTQNFGNTFPGACDAVRDGPGQPGHRRPGRLRLQAGHIHGFSQTHLSGVGCGVAARCR